MRLLLYSIFLFNLLADIQGLQPLNFLKLSQRILNPSRVRKNIAYCNNPKRASQISKVLDVDFTQYSPCQLNAIIVEASVAPLKDVPINIDTEDKRTQIQSAYCTTLHRKILGAALSTTDRRIFLVDKNALAEWFIMQGFKEKKISSYSSLQLLKLKCVYMACQQRMWLESIVHNRKD